MNVLQISIFANCVLIDLDQGMAPETIVVILIVQLIGLAMVIHSTLQLFGIDILYVLKLMFSKRARVCRKQLYKELRVLISRRLELVAKLLDVGRLNNGVAPTIKLSLREVKKVGGKYTWGKGTVRIDVPVTCRVEDLLPSLDHELTHFLQDRVLKLDPREVPRFVIEGMASLVELLIHGKIRGYEKELLEYITWCFVQDRNIICYPLVHLGEERIGGS